MMTANHEHTPTMYDIRDQFIEAWAGDFVFGKVGAAKYFDRALDAHNARIEAAAEQIGTIKALQVVRELHKPFDWSFSAGDQVYTITSCAECARLGADEEDAIYPCPTVQAITDQEGDDE